MSYFSLLDLAQSELLVDIDLQQLFGNLREIYNVHLDFWIQSYLPVLQEAIFNFQAFLIFKNKQIRYQYILIYFQSYGDLSFERSLGKLRQIELHFTR